MFTAPKNTVLAALGSCAVLGLLPLTSSAQTIISFTPTTAAPGGTVTITGTGLATTKAVSLHGQLLPVTSAAATTLVVKVPAAANTGKIRVTTTAGTVLSSTALGVTRTSSKLTATYVEQGATSAGSITTTDKYSTPVAADLDRDGLMELLVGDGTGNIEVYSKSSSSATTLISKGNATANGATLKVTNYSKPTVSDLDGDGLLELIVGTGTGKSLVAYEQTSATSLTAFGAGTTLTTKASSTATAAAMAFNSFPKPSVGDLDGDGLLDLLVGDGDPSTNATTNGSGNIFRFEQSAANSLVFVTMGTLKDASGNAIGTGSATTKPNIIDIDGDGNLDLLVGSSDGSVKLYTQTATNAVTFKAAGNLTTDGSTAISMANNGGFAAPTITDYDGDGLLDYFFGNGNGALYRYEQTASTVSPLPVVLVSFAGQALGAGSQLNWATASELNSAYFAVERSANGQDFVQLTQVAAAGNSSSARTYQYLDAAAPAGTSYYRLRQVDQDGAVAYSPVVALSRPTALGATKPQVYPTVFDTELHVALPEVAAPEAATASLLTTDGRAVFSQVVQLSATPQALASLPTLAPGMYLLRIATAAGTTTQRVVHQ